MVRISGKDVVRIFGTGTRLPYQYLAETVSAGAHGADDWREKGELLSLTYADLDLDAGTAYLRQTKNGSERVLPLVPLVVIEIRRFKAKKPELRAVRSRQVALAFPVSGSICLRILFSLGKVRFIAARLRNNCARRTLAPSSSHGNR